MQQKKGIIRNTASFFGELYKDGGMWKWGAATAVLALMADATFVGVRDIFDKTPEPTQQVAQEKTTPKLPKPYTQIAFEKASAEIAEHTPLSQEGAAVGLGVATVGALPLIGLLPLSAFMVGLMVDENMRAAHRHDNQEIAKS